MSIEELSKLSDEELRVRCAELCGYLQWQNKDGTVGGWKTEDDDDLLDWSPPNYPADLNAMHEAENTMTEEELYSYDDFLLEQNMKSNKRDGNASDWLWHATARQRCIAFIATMQSK